MSILNLAAMLSLNWGPFKQGIKAAEHEADHLAKHLKQAFTAIAVIELAHQTMEYGARIGEVSDRINVATDDLQKMEFAAKQSGAGLEDITSAFRGLGKARLAALGGDEETSRMFEALGVDKVALQGDKIVDIFRKIAKTVHETDFGASEEGLIEKILGKSAATLIPMFKSGLQELEDEATKLGVVIDNSTVESLRDMQDQIEAIIAEFRGPFASAVSEVGKFVARIVEGIQLAYVGLKVIGRGFTGQDNADNLKQGARERDAILDKIIERENAMDAKRNRTRRKQEFTPLNSKEVEDAKKVLEIKKQIEEIERKTQMEGMTDARKKIELHKQIEQLIVDRSNIIESGKDSEVAEIDKQIAERKFELKKLEVKNKSGITDILNPNHDTHLTVAALNRMAGRGFVGAGMQKDDVPKRQLTVQEMQLEVLRIINSKTRPGVPLNVNG